MYDLVIIGAGAAGLSAGLYAARANLNTLVIDKGLEGGQIVNTEKVENYPGILEIGGMEFGQTLKKQAESFGCKVVMDDIQEVDLTSNPKVLKGRIDTYEAKTVILANGASHRTVGAEGEEVFSGRGISYCATCDAAFYQDKEVYVVGGGDAAVEEALFITRFASKVHLIHRRNQLRASEDLQAQAKANPKIDYMWDTEVVKFSGDKMLSSFDVRNIKTGETKTISSDDTFGVFVFVGYVPQTALVEGQVTLEDGYIVTNDHMATNIAGVFAAGDIRAKKVRQLVTAAADGVVAAVSADQYIAEQEGTLYEGLVQA
ncbi:thioredoxin-disulfide reductase [Peptoniphilus equinus]|uniref:Thioredoxin reductase n=1 Tax=Peptoniphilus equinus TaxID=3016343 RepID=A0ABY7QVP9_9FIRM|nr:thioredoxin-disulfide reductase [Peptoniphilus equinus]WBW50431.1 thioredoxin-disulfide reductase [Peptoniphilus equinus]